MKRCTFCVILTLYRWILRRKITRNATINCSNFKRQNLCQKIHHLLHIWTRCNKLLSCFSIAAWFHITLVIICQVGWPVPTKSFQWTIEWATSQIKLYVVKIVEGNASKTGFVKQIMQGLPIIEDLNPPYSQL